MSAALHQSRLDSYDLHLDYLNPEQKADEGFKTPSRLRGELFDQPQRTIYVFGSYDHPIPLSLQVYHDQRLIVAEVDVATRNSLQAEWPTLSQRKLDCANRLLPRLRWLYVGGWSKAVRLLRREKADYHLQGPFIPRQRGVAIVSLMIRVGLDSNFDRAYKIAQQFLEQHPENELNSWGRRKPEPPKVPGAYEWNDHELRAIEDMAPLEPEANSFGADRTDEERDRFNEIVWRQCQERMERTIPDEENNASFVAESILREFFNRRV